MKVVSASAPPYDGQLTGLVLAISWKAGGQLSGRPPTSVSDPQHHPRRRGSPRKPLLDSLLGNAEICSQTSLGDACGAPTGQFRIELNQGEHVGKGYQFVKLIDKRLVCDSLSLF